MSKYLHLRFWFSSYSAVFCDIKKNFRYIHSVALTTVVVTCAAVNKFTFYAVLFEVQYNL